MSTAPPRPTQFIWATRGHSWGFRFLLDAGFDDPLPAYERAFAGLADHPTAWRRESRHLALRFPDPVGRRDAAGRVIPHEFVVFGDVAGDIGSVDDGVQTIWPIVEHAYARIWDSDKAPTANDLRLGD
ncbi:hypothetical protein ACXR8F_09235 [Terrabacter sp. AAH1]